jgi:hypothetical protein
MYIYIRICINIQTYKHTHKHIYTYKRAHLHTYTHMYTPLQPPFRMNAQSTLMAVNVLPKPISSARIAPREEYTYIYTCMCMYICRYVFMYVCKNIHMCKCIYTYICKHIYIHVHIYTYICTYI